MDPFAGADAANTERAKIEALARLQRERAARRDNQPLPIGSLFDDVSRAQSDLFTRGERL